MRFPRAAGVLLHPTSLPSPYGIGDLGESAYRFVEFLAESGQTLWQILPLGPTGYGDSPYASFSAFAGNPLLLNLAWMVAEGDVAAKDLEQAAVFPEDHVDFGPVITYKMAVLHRAARTFRKRGDAARHESFDAFCAENADWLDDYALFMALKDAHGGAVWNTWEWELASRNPEALASWRERLDEAVFAYRYFQYQFFRQWAELKKYANDKGIKIIGDIPIFVAYDSADVWANPELFYLDENRLSTVVAGVPPDYFSATGQLWGNPLYRWDVNAATGYSWWISRIQQVLRMVDMVRMDHFRGFESYWEIPAGEPTAVHGRWAPGPGASLFKAVAKALGQLPIIAEDLGFITKPVYELRDRFEFPGMKILQFAFSTDATNEYLPHNYTTPNAVVYTGTHDNDTTMGWFESREAEERLNCVRYVGPTEEPVNWALIRMAYNSIADIAIAPLQDIFGLGCEARMNTPGRLGGNWSWRFKNEDLTPELSEKLLEMSLTYGRKEPAEKKEKPEWM